MTPTEIRGAVRTLQAQGHSGIARVVHERGLRVSLTVAFVCGIGGEAALDE